MGAVEVGKIIYYKFLKHVIVFFALCAQKGLVVSRVVDKG